jgi:uncharacterized membrane protein
VDAQWKVIAGLCGGFAAYALTAGLIARALVGLMSRHSAAQGNGWEMDILLAHPVFQAMHFLMVFVVVSAVFLAFAMVCAQIHHRRKQRLARQPRSEANTPHILNEKWEA